MLFTYGNVLAFAVIGTLLIFGALFAGSLLRPSVPSLEKNSTYECGEVPTGSAWVNFNIRFYVTALVFVVFDVEVVFMFPVARVFVQDWVAKGQGLLAFTEILAFVAILAVGFVYAWTKGDLDWVKKIAEEIKQS